MFQGKVPQHARFACLPGDLRSFLRNGLYLQEFSCPSKSFQYISVAIKIGRWGNAECGAKTLGRCGVIIWFSGLGVLLISVCARGSTVAPMTVQNLADYSGAVLVGRISTVRSYWTDQPQRIETEVVFQNPQFWKGADFPGSSENFTLIVPGGRVGEMEMRIAGTPRFQVGQKWVLCLLPSYKTFPVVGLWNGAYEVRSDGKGRERVYQKDGRPVLGLSENGMIRLGGKIQNASGGNMQLNPLRNQRPLRERGAQPEKAMTLLQFAALLRPRLDQSRSYTLKHPPGKPIPVTLRATTIREVKNAQKSADRAPRQ